MNKLSRLLLRAKARKASTISHKARDDVTQFVDACKRQYNSEEQTTEREEWYNEIHRIGKLREAAFKRGEPMDNYPLPFDTHPETFDDFLEQGEKHYEEELFRVL